MTAPALLAETRLSLHQAAARLGVSPCTVRRWANAGVRGPGGAMVRLETAKVGGHRVTSAEACDRWLGVLNPGAAVPTRTPAQARRASEAADAELERAGW
jgi:DNA-binding transcriptional regulator YdaS (Cro superfamily)